MKVMLYISFAADLLAVVLMIIQLVRLRRLPAEKAEMKRYFGIFSVMVFLMSALHLLNSYAELRLNALTPKDYLAVLQADLQIWVWMAAASFIVDIFLSTVFLYQWISFLCWHLYEDKDLIRRRFWLGFAPLLISAAVTGISVPLAVLTDKGYVFSLAAVIAFFVIRVFYFVTALRLLFDYKKQNGYLRFFNPWVFFVPVALGWLLQDILWWGFAAIGSTLGVILLYNSIIYKDRYVDRETGLYNRDFIGYLKGLVSRKKYAPCSAMTFTVDSPGKMKAFSGKLKEQLPNDCEPILCTDCRVVVLTNLEGRGPLTMVIGDVMAVTEAEGKSTLKKKTETTEAFMERVL